MGIILLNNGKNKEYHFKVYYKKLKFCGSIFFQERDHIPFFPMDDNLKFFLHQDNCHKTSHEFLMLLQNNRNKKAQIGRKLVKKEKSRLDKTESKAKKAQ